MFCSIVSVWQIEKSDRIFPCDLAIDRFRNTLFSQPVIKKLFCSKWHFSKTNITAEEKSVLKFIQKSTSVIGIHPEHPCRIRKFPQQIWVTAEKFYRRSFSEHRTGTGLGRNITPVRTEC